VSETVSRGREAGQQAEVLAAGAGESRGRGRWVALGIVVVVAAGAVSAWRAGVFSPAASPGAALGAPPPATRPVVREELSSRTPVPATLGYAGSYSVRGQGGGTLTWLPSPGQVIGQGQVLYKTGNGSPVVLLYGSVPDWRALDEGVTGQDVAQLNHDLADLGYADRADVAALGWDYYSWETAYAVLAATSDRHVVTIALSTAQQPQVAAGNIVSVTLPDGAVTPGRITAVGTVASGTAGSATVPVTVTLTRPAAAGTLDQAPVTVTITTAASPGPVLAVPVTALVAQAPGGYEVEVAGPGNTRSWVPVTTGIFDDNSGLVQVTGNLAPRQRVVVPAT
jgi:hypothetical protein